MSRAQLVFLGGTEWYSMENSIFKKMRSLTGKRPQVIVLPIASAEPASTAESYRNFFEEFSSAEVETLQILDRKEASQREYLKKLDEATLLFFTGGNQRRLLRILRETKINDLLIEKLDEDVVFAGTSAGAMAFADIVIMSSEKRCLEERNFDWKYGLDLIRDVIIDTHFFERERIWRLLCAISRFPETVGLGIMEDTAVFYDTAERKFEIKGSGYVFAVEPPTRKIRKERKKERHGYNVSILTEGAEFELTRGSRLTFKE